MNRSVSPEESPTLTNVGRKAVGSAIVLIGGGVEAIVGVVTAVKADGNLGLYTLAALEGALAVALARETRFRWHDTLEAIAQHELVESAAAAQALAQVPHLTVEVDHTPWMPPQPQEPVLAAAVCKQ